MCASRTLWASNWVCIIAHECIHSSTCGSPLLTCNKVQSALIFFHCIGWSRFLLLGGYFRYCFDFGCWILSLRWVKRWAFGLYVWTRLQCCTITTRENIKYERIIKRNKNWQRRSCNGCGGGSDNTPQKRKRSSNSFNNEIQHILNGERIGCLHCEGKINWCSKCVFFLSLRFSLSFGASHLLLSHFEAASFKLYKRPMHCTRNEHWTIWSRARTKCFWSK